MHKAKFAESLLALSYGRRKAAEIVGDALEQQASNGDSFWKAILSALVFSSGRWALAFFLAGASTIYGIVHYINVFQEQPQGSVRLAWVSAACFWQLRSGAQLF